MRMITQNRPAGIDLLDFSATDVDLEDISHALGSLPRYGGHGSTFYSVAEHSIRVAMMVEPRHRLEALLHDAAEAYLGDVVAPLKALLPDYRKIEDRIQAVIQCRFSIPPRLSDQVMEADIRIRGAEIWELFRIPQEVPIPEYMKPPPPLHYNAEDAAISWYRITSMVLEQEHTR